MDAFDKTMLSMSLSTKTPEQRAIHAIKARLDGVWDDPALEAVGPLTPDPALDIQHILEHYNV